MRAWKARLPVEITATVSVLARGARLESAPTDGDNSSYCVCPRKGVRLESAPTGGNNSKDNYENRFVWK